jgi:hypothetical protein
MSTDEAGMTIVNILKKYGCGVSRETVLSEFVKDAGFRFQWDAEPTFRRGLSWSRKRGLIIPTARRHRGQKIYWSYCGDEQ